MKTKVKFKIIYNPADVNKVSDLMEKMDLGINGIVQPRCEEISFSTTTKVDKDYLKNIAKVINKAYEEQGCTVYSVELLWVANEESNKLTEETSEKI